MSANPPSKSTKNQHTSGMHIVENAKISKFINYLMREGKKNVAKKMFAAMMQEIKQAGHINPQSVRETALENASPTIMTKSKRIG